jgi:hypothetical protein
MRLGDTFGEMLISYVPGRNDLRQIERLMDAYTDALERVLGAPSGSLVLMDHESLKAWFEPVVSEGVAELSS